jgi:hypothetical protein
MNKTILDCIRNSSFDQGLTYIKARQEYEEKSKKRLTEINLSKRALKEANRCGLITLKDLWQTSYNERNNWTKLSYETKIELEQLCKV